MSRDDRSVAEAEQLLDDLAAREENGKNRRGAELIHFYFLYAGLAILTTSLAWAIIFQSVPVAVVGLIVGIPVGMYGNSLVIFSIKHQGWKQAKARIERAAFVARLNATTDCYRLWVQFGTEQGGRLADALARVPSAGEPVDWSRAEAIVCYNPAGNDPVVIQQVRLQ
ncbi:hypothetical protein ENSA5_54350 [Enhygromyxa salina]|uniref:Uncharacterized protein n=1 Tax=Enhygromyxa salina TaxID=215803 RepID=A0A2S9XFA8_9BACT|nr:hypothetical protein [Enhygromyxa salina]PRP91527.1 hypothetical protein ENSA5_54350 [Enhygromyxa salina]